MILALVGNEFTVACRLINLDGTMGTGKIVNYTIRNSDDSENVADTPMTESSDSTGVYYANVTISSEGDYRIYFKDSLGAYPIGGESIRVTSEESDITAIKAKTDNLPASPANEATLANATYGLSALKSLLDAVQADLDNPDQYKADVSGVALEATLTAIKGAGWTTETLKAVKDALDLVKSETDKIPRVLGLLHENIYFDNPTYDANNNLTSCRIRIYSVAGSVGTGSNVIGTYLWTATGNGAGKFTVAQQVKQ